MSTNRRCAAALAVTMLAVCGSAFAQGPGANSPDDTGRDDSERDAARAQQADDEPVISFDAAGRTRPDRDDERNGETAPGGAEEMISFRLENAPWEMVLRRFAQRAGYTLQMLDLPPGTLNYNDPREYTPAEALDVLHGYLLQEGFVMVKRDRFLVVLNVEKRPIPPNLIPDVAVEDLPDRGKHELVNVVFPLGGGDAESLAEELDPLLGPQGSVTALPTSNSIVVTDTAANVRKVQRLVENVTEADPEVSKFRRFQLKYVDAEEAARMVKDQLGLAAGVQNVSEAAERARYYAMRGRDGDDNDRNRTPTPPQPTPIKAQITPDNRSNALLVTATADVLSLVEEMLATIDIGEDDYGNPILGGSGAPYLKVYELERAEADEVAKTLGVLKPGVVVNEEDGRNDFLHVKATEKEHREIAALIEQLDGRGNQQVAVLPLSSLDPLGVAATLRSLFAPEEEDAPSIEADTLHRRLLVRGTEPQVAQIRTLLTQLGEDGSGGPFGRQTGPVRMIPLGGRDAAAFADLLERAWSASESTPIRIVVPSDRGPVEDRRVPTAPEQSFNPDDLDDLSPLRRTPAQRPTERPIDRPAQRPPLGDRSTDNGNAAPRTRAVNFLAEVEAITEAAEAADETDEADEPNASQPQAAADGKVTVLVGGDGTVSLNGHAIAAIDELESHLKRLTSDYEPDQREVTVVVDPRTPAIALAAVFEAVQRAGLKPSLSTRTIESTRTPAANAPAGPAAAESSDAPRRSTSPAPVDGPAPEDGTADGAAGARPGSVVVTYRDGQLVVISRDEEALDRLETLAAQLAEAIPVKPAWTVFYLRSADALETATMLEQLFPTSTVALASTPGTSSFMGSLTGGLSSFGNSLMDVTGLSGLGGEPLALRIIPDMRSNSLFVSGPANMVQDVERMIEVLDSNELPENLRERLPRMIPVEYANVQEVSTIIQEVYHDYMEDPNAGRSSRGGGNPLAMLMGGGGGGGDSRRPSGVRLTVGVDVRTNTIVVSANDALFRQIEAVVQDLDEAAYEARETVRVVSIGEADAVVVQQALGSLLPSVQVSSTNQGGRSGQSGSPWQQNGSRGGDNDNDNGGDQMRQYFEQRMRERMMEQMRGGSNTSSGSSWGSRGGYSSRGGYDRGGDSGRGDWGRGDYGRSFGGGDSRGGFDRSRFFGRGGDDD
jgi:type II secretory pathway component GspD/PulD (secretin)